MERDSVSSVIARDSLSISERVSGNRRLQLFRLDGAPQVYQYSFAADGFGDDTRRNRHFASYRVGIGSGAIRYAGRGG